MAEYGFLVLPSHNRVYSQAAPDLARAELAVFSETALAGKLTGIGGTTLGGVPYVTFRADGLTAGEVRLLSNLSSLYALFEITGQSLRPVPLDPLDRFGSDLLTIAKYPGKTNEDFTKLLLNVTAMATASPWDLLAGKLRVLDPLCGRGTTLNQAMMYGLDAAGLDIDGKDFDAYSAFIQTWLKHNRVKHHAETSTIRRDRAVAGRRLHIVLGASKEQYRAGDTIELTAVHADTLACGSFFRPESFDLIVTDTPYGVQHGSRRPPDARGGRSVPGGRGGREVLSRSPVELLAASVPGWIRLLRPGGAIGISWNTHVARRDAIAAILDGSGCEVAGSPAYLGFRHRVDQAIIRDLIVARKRPPAAAGGPPPPPQ